VNGAAAVSVVRPILGTAASRLALRVLDSLEGVSPLPEVRKDQLATETGILLCAREPNLRW